jgi:hypothetical protein
VFPHTKDLEKQFNDVVMSFFEAGATTLSYNASVVKINNMGRFLELKNIFL